MIRTGIYRGGNVYYRVPLTKHLSGGNWDKGFSGVKRSGGNVVVYEVLNRLDMWPSGNQEVEFEIKEDKAIVKKLGKIYDSVEADKLTNPFKVI